ncbi:MAG: sulfite exporter TauE/SafE family protein, partial [Synergistaceae bacterium]|nr:sulfite exporter TauE/SafE family protein [Synergistaceae bacterium]
SVKVDYDADKIDIGEVKKLVEELDYHVVKEGQQRRTSDAVLRIIWVSIALYELYALLDRFELLNIFYNFPEAKAGMGYGMLFVVGLLTSVHCVAMCGGINLSQSLSRSLPASPAIPLALAEYIDGNAAARFTAIRSGFLYNLGRVVSYTLIGGAVGLLGAVVSPSESVRGYIQLAAGVFMVIMGLNMLNIFPWLRRLNPHMPKIFADKIHAGKNNGPLYVGLLNGFMPCGPLQAMQLYALSTGNFIKGALSMFVFSAGTLPLMFGLSALSSILSKKFTRGMMTVGATMVVIMGVAMFGNGMSLTGISFTQAGGSGTQTAAAQIQDGVQLVKTELKPGRYAPIKVQVGIPVRWTIHAEPGTINGCNNRIVIPEYDRLQKKLEIGDNIVEFTPTRTGTFTYACWMGMIRGKITVVEEDAGNPVVAADALPPVLADDGNAKPDPDYDADPFAELFGATGSENAEPPGSPDFEDERYANNTSCCRSFRAGGWDGLSEEDADPNYGTAFASFPAEKVFAKVGAREITKADIEGLIQMMGPQGAIYDNARGRKAVLGELVNSCLFALSGEKQELDNSPEFKRILDDFSTQALARIAIEKALENIVVLEEEIRNFYEENVAPQAGYDEAKPMIARFLSNNRKSEKYREELENLKKEYKVEIFLPDGDNANVSSDQALEEPKTAVRWGSDVGGLNGYEVSVRAQ